VQRARPSRLGAGENILLELIFQTFIADDPKCRRTLFFAPGVTDVLSGRRHHNTSRTRVFGSVSFFFGLVASAP